MKTDWHDPQDRAWGEVLEGAAHDFYHLPEYALLSAKHDGALAKALVVQDGASVMLLPLLVRSIPNAGEDATSPYGYPGPIFVNTPPDSSFPELAFRAGMEFLADQGLVSAFIRLHPLLNRAMSPGPGVMVEHGETVFIDLSLPDEQLWAQTRASHRYEVRRALREGLEVVVDEEEHSFDQFARIYRETMARVSADDYYYFDEAYFAGLRHALAGHLHLGMVVSGDAVAAAGLFVETAGIVQYHLSGSDERFSRYAPTKLLLHHMRGWAKARGNRWVSLGGGFASRDDPLFQFKAGFSPIRLRFRTLRLILRPAEYARLAKAHLDEGTLERGRASPSDFFPAYRRPVAG